jgi:hypothetical protein
MPTSELVLGALHALPLVTGLKVPGCISSDVCALESQWRQNIRRMAQHISNYSHAAKTTTKTYSKNYRMFETTCACVCVYY